MTVAHRLLGALLGTLLGAQAIGKLLDMRLYVIALERFRALPKGAVPFVAYLWVAMELVAFVALGWAAVRASRNAAIVGAAAASTDALAYAVLTIGTRLRGIDVLNCTCFGAYLPQRLSTSVLIQDLVMVGWTLWMLKSALNAADVGIRW